MKILKYIILFLILGFYIKVNAQSETFCADFTLKIVEYLKHNQADSVALQFNNEVASKLKANDLKILWSQLETSMGTFQKAEGLQKFFNENMLIYERILFFENQSLKLRVTYDTNNKIAGLYFVPNRKARGELKLENNEFYSETEIKIGKTEAKMQGILCLPKQVKNFPIVVLVHGSGIHDKDETIGLTKPFKVLAHELAKNNIACIRYDKRAERPEGFDSLHSMQSMIVDDVLSAIELASQIEGVDTNRIVVIGHSLGGMLAPMIASQSRRVKAVILLAGNSRPLEDLILEQSIYLASRSGLTKDEKVQLKKLKKQVKNVKNLDKLKNPYNTDFPLGISYQEWKEFKEYNQVEKAKFISQPMLILQGERDYQVTMKDFNVWKSELKYKTNVYYRSFKGLNHLFCKGEGASFPEEYYDNCKIDAEVIAVITRWIQTDFKF